MMYPRIRNAILLSLVALALQAVAFFIVAKFSTEIRLLGLFDYCISAINLIVFGSLSMYGLRRANVSVTSFLQYPPSWKLLLITILLLVLPVVILSAILGSFAYKSSHIVEKVGNFAAKGVPVDEWALVVAALIVSPIVEEVFFRGFLFRGLLKTRSVWIAGITSTLLFAILHLNPTQIISALFLGSFATFAYFLSRNLIFPIAIHIWFNFYAMILPRLLHAFGIQQIGPSFKTGFYTFDLFDGLGLIFLILGMYFLVQYLRKYPLGDICLTAHN